MLGSEVLEVGIGICLLFFFMSLIATALSEAAENIIKARAKYLEAGIMELLKVAPAADKSMDATQMEAEAKKASQELVSEFYQHPLISALYAGEYKSGSRHLPSYIPRENFSLAVLDLLSSKGGGSPLSIDTLRQSLNNSGSPNSAQRVLLAAIDTTGNDMQKVRKIFEDWFDSSMDRVSGWYKRRSGYVLAAIGLFAAVASNVDAIAVAKSLISDKSLREAVVSQAEVTIANGIPVGGSKSLDQLNKEMSAIGFPVGWKYFDGGYYPTPQSCTSKMDPNKIDPKELDLTFECKDRTWGIAMAVPGWLITALAIMLGAPFWFDMLNKLMVIRSTVKSKEKSPDEGSEDRSPKPSNGSAGGADAGPGSAGGGSSNQVGRNDAEAEVAALEAAQQNAFVPNRWNDAANPDGGKM